MNSLLIIIVCCVALFTSTLEAAKAHPRASKSRSTAQLNNTNGYHKSKGLMNTTFIATKAHPRQKTLPAHPIAIKNRFTTKPKNANGYWKPKGILNASLIDKHRPIDKFSNLSLDGVDTTKLNYSYGYWTPERLMNATPIDMHVEYNEDLDNWNSTRFKRQSIWTADNLRSAKPIENDISGSLRQLGIEPPEIMEVVGMSEKYVGDVTEFPAYNYGKLYARSPRGYGWCTAAFIRPNILITAAHCVKDASGWYKDFAFFQRYQGPYNKGREVKVRAPWTFKNYIDGNGNKNYKVDYAFVETVESADGTPLAENFAGQPSANALMYFGGYPFDTEGGNKLIWSSGTRNPDIATLNHAPTNPLTAGSSGGAWITKVSGVYKVVGVASHVYTSSSTYTGAFSPVLDSETSRLLSLVENDIAATKAKVTMHIEGD